MPPKKKEQAKAGPKAAVDKTFGLKNVFSQICVWQALIAEKQIEKSTAICATGPATAGGYGNQCKGKGSFL